MRTREQFLASIPRADRFITSPRPGGSGTIDGRAASLVHQARRARDLGDMPTADSLIRTLDDLLGAFVDGLFVGGADLVAGRVSIDTLHALCFGTRDATRDAEIAARARAARAK